MTVLYRNLSLALDDDEGDIPRLAARKLRVRPESISHYQIVRKSIDARQGRLPRFTYTLALDLEPADEDRLLAKQGGPVVPFEPVQFLEVPKVASPDRTRPVIVGAGPAGLLAAYRLAQAGTPGIVIERGLAVRERSIQWNGFLKGRQSFDPESNLLYGEGGAGTYSDGKLYTRVNDPRAPEVLQVLAECGAPSDILIDAKPHVGSNLLPSIIRRLRDRLIDGGTEFRFSTRLTDLLVDAGRVVGVVTEPGGVIDCSTVFLGLGHSARDTLRMLHERGVAMERKPFQIGARVEHSQALVDAMQYGEATGHPKLPPADYRLVQKLRGGDLFSFCMCPGGEILPATEKSGFICVNGASRYKRIGDFANSGFVVTLHPEQFGAAASDVLAGIVLQEKIEADAAQLASHPFGAPALRLIDFIERRESTDLPPSSYPLPLSAARFEEFLPRVVLDPLRDGLEALCRRIPTFRDPEAVIVGPESRSSSPVRILRSESTLESPSAAGLYPMGEGAGFAGGILSAAIDGMLCAERHLAISTGENLVNGHALIDSGEQSKLERFGEVTLVRPSSQALWRRRAGSRWSEADATFERDRRGTGRWLERGALPTTWRMTFADVTWNLRPNDHGNIGIFPEQAPCWQWIERVLAARESAGEPPEVLNLFAYTGGSTFAAARSGARVVHLDASKTSVATARENAECSGLAKRPIRWITDDAVKFARRELKRGRRYQGVVLDPPTFGRGAASEVWRIEEGIGELLDLCRALLADDASFVLFTSHSPGFTPIALENQLEAPADSELESGEMTIAGEDGRLLPSGAFARWRRT